MLVGCVKESNLLRPYKDIFHKKSTILQNLAQEFELHLETIKMPGKFVL